MIAGVTIAGTENVNAGFAACPLDGRAADEVSRSAAAAQHATATTRLPRPSANVLVVPKVSDD